ncbi:MAG: glutamate-1-semialdehyde 2,1-aminomutase [Kiritimatiellae bacterium]|nr:glutamate-1-semialdehyde 2,1-aminomutase [Kiritimatiellia bacterium]
MDNVYWHKRATAAIPGGVNSPVRAFGGVGGTPLFVKAGKGALIYSADGREYVDFCCSWGAMILGHARAEIVDAIAKRAAGGTTFGIATPDEVVFAEKVLGFLPTGWKLRAVSSGTEAVMTALRLARGVTGRDIIVKFEGCYHGHSDAMLVKGGSGLLTGAVASSGGVPAGAVEDTVCLPYNDTEAARRFFATRGSDVAAVIVEPVAGNMGLVKPVPGFLEALREETKRAGALLICDEVINAFRFCLGAWSDKIAGVAADIVTLGKIVGGGLPLAAVAARAEIMDRLAPEGNVYQAGTLAGNPLAVAAGLRTLELLGNERPYGRMAELAKTLEEGLEAEFRRKGLPMSVGREGGVFTIFARPQPPADMAQAMASDGALYARLFHRLYEDGVYIAPSRFEVNFVSAAHGEGDIARVIESVKRF